MVLLFLFFFSLSFSIVLLLTRSVVKLSTFLLTGESEGLRPGVSRFFYPSLNTRTPKGMLFGGFLLHKTNQEAFLWVFWYVLRFVIGCSCKLLLGCF